MVDIAVVRLLGREDGSSQANGTAGQEEAVPRPAALFQPLSGSAESIQQDAGASSDASDDLLEAAQCLWDAVLPRAVWGEGFDDVAGELGMAELRGHLREPALLATCPEGWQATEERHYDGAFDWGYVPLFLETCIDPKDAALVPGWQAKLPKRWNGKATQRLLRCQTETESADVPADGTAVLKIVAAPVRPCPD